VSSPVIPANAGIHFDFARHQEIEINMDPGVHRDDESGGIATT
jgi:hypothetical protein